jgi:hypothetical protein
VLPRFVACLAYMSLLGGCSASEVFYVDNEFTKDEEAAIQAAADAWATDGTAFYLAFGTPIDAEQTDKRAIVRVSADYMRAKAAEEHAEGGEAYLHVHHTMFGLEWETMALAPDIIDPGRLESVVAHEFGHALGILFHVPTPAIMSSRSTSTCLTKNDVEALVATFGTDPAEYHPCD